MVNLDSIGFIGTAIAPQLMLRLDQSWIYKLFSSGHNQKKTFAKNIWILRWRVHNHINSYQLVRKQNLKYSHLSHFVLKANITIAKEYTHTPIHIQNSLQYSF